MYAYVYTKAGLHVPISEVDTRETLSASASIEVGANLNQPAKETASPFQNAPPHTPPRSEPPTHLGHPEHQESPLPSELPPPFPSPDQVRPSDSQEEPVVSSSGKPKKSLAANIQVLFLSSHK